MKAVDVLAKMEKDGRGPVWTIDDAKAVVVALGGKPEVVDLAEFLASRTRSNQRADTMATMYCMTLIAAKLEQENQQ